MFARWSFFQSLPITYLHPKHLLDLLYVSNTESIILPELRSHVWLRHQQRGPSRSQLNHLCGWRPKPETQFKFRYFGCLPTNSKTGAKLFDLQPKKFVPATFIPTAESHQLLRIRPHNTISSTTFFVQVCFNYLILACDTSWTISQYWQSFTFAYEPQHSCDIPATSRIIPSNSKVQPVSLLPFAQRCDSNIFLSVLHNVSIQHSHRHGDLASEPVRPLRWCPVAVAGSALFQSQANWRILGFQATLKA